MQIMSYDRQRQLLANTTSTKPGDKRGLVAIKIIIHVLKAKTWIWIGLKIGLISSSLFKKISDEWYHSFLKNPFQVKLHPSIVVVWLWMM